eukprot:TRINITY_DN526_c0_g1_i1.p1 TRINITY_DN526_c0_g1~~TRINITY_DN526_c0_g1_i1.p1  ORF type:complete len:424 (+),score=82.09 TRINITY_DN526_c0_g1_i1:183-1454(+)
MAARADFKMDMLDKGFVSDWARRLGASWTHVAWKYPGGVGTKDVDDVLGHSAPPIDKCIKFFEILCVKQVPVDEVCKAIREGGYPAHVPTEQELKANTKKPGDGIQPNPAPSDQGPTAPVVGGGIQPNPAPSEQVPTAPAKTDEEPNFAGSEWFDAADPDIVDASSGKIKQQQVKPQVILHTVNDTEFTYMLRKLDGIQFDGNAGVLQCVEDGDVYFIGACGKYIAVLVQSTPGSLSAAGSTLVLNRAIQSWGKLPIISVGVACGRGGSKQQLGDVLIANEIIPYEPMRVGATEIPRGVSFPAHRQLLASFKNLRTWKFVDHKGRKVERIVGRVLSGEKLIDDDATKKKLFASEPEAIGLEMEGSGAISVAQALEVPYILVKGICDWGDGHKHKGYQPLAAAAAASLVKVVCNTAGTLDFPHV